MIIKEVITFASEKSNKELLASEWLNPDKVRQRQTLGLMSHMSDYTELVNTSILTRDITTGNSNLYNYNSRWD